MANFVLTGSSSGIGFALYHQLQQAGHQVLSIDLKGADINVDLTDSAALEMILAKINSFFPEGIDGFIPCAGVGPDTKPYSLITKINYFSVTRLALAILPNLIKRNGCLVLVSSNSASMGGLDPDYVSALIAGDEAKACDIVEGLDGHNAYAGSKFALTCWMRAQSTVWAKQGVRANAVAPGITHTAMTDKVLKDEVLGGFMKTFGESVPLGKIAEPEQIANVMMFLLSPQANFMTGSVVFVDGGHDAMLRPDIF